MSVAEIKNNALELATTKMASFQESIEEVDWKGHALTFINFGKEKAIDIYQTIKNESIVKGFQKAYLLAEAVPYLNTMAAAGRIYYAIAYALKVGAASLTTRPYNLGIKETGNKLFKEEIPYILKQIARAGFVFCFTADAGVVANLTTSLAVYSYDVITNNIEALKNHKYVPNYWA